MTRSAVNQASPIIHVLRRRQGHANRSAQEIVDCDDGFGAGGREHLGREMSNLFADFGLLERATSTQRTLSGGDLIFREGDPAREFFIVRTGSVAILSGNRTLGRLGPGEVFGEMALIDSSPRSATAFAETDGTVIVPVSEKQFLFMISEAPYFALSIMRVLAERLRAANHALPGD
jgi:CRP/FNR family transcriptional regulator, cyclic AMP receptor protein